MSIASSRRTQNGLTMVELVVFIVVIAIGVTGILQVMNLTVKNSADPVRRKQAISLAEGLLEEVMRARFTYCDPADPLAEVAASVASCTIPERFGREPGNDSRPYDNINDYVTVPNVEEAAFSSGAPAVLRDATGAPFPIPGYTATLKITPEIYGGIPVTGNGANLADANALRITVTVTYDGESIALEGYRTRYAPQLMP